MMAASHPAGPRRWRGPVRALCLLVLAALAHERASAQALSARMTSVASSSANQNKQYSTSSTPRSLSSLPSPSSASSSAPSSLAAAAAAAAAAATDSANKQHANTINSNANQLLVSNTNHHEPSPIRFFAQSLPLTRQQQQQQLPPHAPLAQAQSQPQQADLDNVIESTTSHLALSGGSSVAPNALAAAGSAAYLLGAPPGKLAGAYSAASVASAAAAAASACQLPQTWAGKWYQSNKEPTRITNTEISDKGLCRDQKGDKFLFESSGNSKQQSSPCLVCLVINERHLNVLQYKESSCQQIPSNYLNRTSNNLIIDDDHSLLDSICSDITGDAQLESLFRLDTPAIECPIGGQFAFTYDACREPQSSLDSCIDKKQLNFKFNACPDVPGSESKYEVLKCYADWSEGNNYFMIGRLEQASSFSDKGKFRCFVYEKSPDGKTIQMAQSLEESCYGLINANEGPKLLRLTAKPPSVQRCQFPAYIQSQSDNWLSVDNSLIYMFNQNSSKYQVKETKEGNVIEEATCLQQYVVPQAHQPLHQQPQQQQAQQRLHHSRGLGGAGNSRRFASPDQAVPAQAASPRSAYNDIVFLVQITKKCHTTNYCVRFHKRSNGIVQIDYFESSPGSDNQCRNAYTGVPQTQIITSTNLEHQRCPFEGAYTIEASPESDLTYNPSNIFVCPRQSFLTAQCDHPSRLRIHSRCSSAKFYTKNLYCLGSWTSHGLVRLLLADDERQRYSAWYRDYAMLDHDQQPAAALTRSQHLLAAAAPEAPPSPIIDLQIALITPLPIVAKPMQVRLTRRNQCSELRGYPGATSSGLASMSGTSSSLSGYSSASSSRLALSLYSYLKSSMLLLILTGFLAHRTHPRRATLQEM